MTNETPAEAKRTPAFIKFPGGCLRPRMTTDEELLRSCCGINDPENRMYLLKAYPQSLGSQRDWFQKPDTPDNIVLIVEYKGEAIGTMGAHRIDMIHGVATTGALFWEQKYWNKGIGTLAKMVFLDYLFNRLNLRIIYSDVISFNGRSARYSDKCGYKQIGVLPKRFRYGRDFADELILAVTFEEWLPWWEKFQKEQGIETREEMIVRHKMINRKST